MVIGKMFKCCIVTRRRKQECKTPFWSAKSSSKEPKKGDGHGEKNLMSLVAGNNNGASNHGIDETESTLLFDQSRSNCGGDVGIVWHHRNTSLTFEELERKVSSKKRNENRAAKTFPSGYYGCTSTNPCVEEAKTDLNGNVNVSEPCYNFQEQQKIGVVPVSFDHVRRTPMLNFIENESDEITDWTLGVLRKSSDTSCHSIEVGNRENAVDDKPVRHSSQHLQPLSLPLRYENLLKSTFKNPCTNDDKSPITTLCTINNMTCPFFHVIGENVVDSSITNTMTIMESPEETSVVVIERNIDDDVGDVGERMNYCFDDNGSPRHCCLSFSQSYLVVGTGSGSTDSFSDETMIGRFEVYGKVPTYEYRFVV